MSNDGEAEKHKYGGVGVRWMEDPCLRSDFILFKLTWAAIAVAMRGREERRHLPCSTYH